MMKRQKRRPSGRVLTDSGGVERCSTVTFKEESSEENYSRLLKTNSDVTSLEINI